MLQPFSSRVPNCRTTAHYWATACSKLGCGRDGQVRACVKLHSHMRQALVLTLKAPFARRASRTSTSTCCLRDWSFTCKNKHTPCAKLHSRDWRVQAPTARRNGAICACLCLPLTSPHHMPGQAGKVGNRYSSLPVKRYMPHIYLLFAVVGCKRWLGRLTVGFKSHKSETGPACLYAPIYLINRILLLNDGSL